MKKLLFLFAFGIFSSTYAQYTLIPDTVFEQKLIDLGIDSDATLNGQVLNSDIVNVHSLNLNTNGFIQDLTGIEGFVNLDTLICREHFLHQIDLSANTQLKYLDLHEAGLESLDVSALPLLEYLDCSNEVYVDYVCDCFNYFPSLNLSQNLNLKTFRGNANGLYKVVLPQSANLEYVEMQAVALHSCNFDDLSGLKHLDLAFSDFPRPLNLSNNPLLEYLDVNKTALINLDLSNNPLIETLYLGYFFMPSEGIEELGGDNYFPVLDMSILPNLKTLVARKVGLSQLDISQNLDLETLAVSLNPLGDIDLTNNISLKNLDVSHCDLTAIDLSQNIDLEWLRLGYFEDFSGASAFNYPNYIPSVDLSNNSALFWLELQGIGLQALDVSQNTHLKYINISNNLLPEFSIASNPEVERLYCKNTFLNKLDLKNGHNSTLEYLYAYTNPSLYCIQVDDVTYANNAPHWFKDAQAVYSTDCASQAIVDGKQQDLHVFPVPAGDKLYIEGKIADIQSIAIYDVAGKRVFYQPVFNSLYVSLEKLSPGVYYLEMLMQNAGNVRKKFVKK